MHWLLQIARDLEFLRNSELDMIRIQAEMYAKKETSDDRQQSQ